MRVKPGVCPTCNREYAGDIESRGHFARPKQGDIGVCLHCGTMLIFRERRGQLVRELPTQEDIESLGPEHLAEVDKVVRFLMRKNRVSGFQS